VFLLKKLFDKCDILGTYLDSNCLPTRHRLNDEVFELASYYLSKFRLDLVRLNIREPTYIRSVSQNQRPKTNRTITVRFGSNRSDFLEMHPNRTRTGFWKMNSNRTEPNSSHFLKKKMSNWTELFFQQQLQYHQEKIYQQQINPKICK